MKNIKVRFLSVFLLSAIMLGFIPFAEVKVMPAMIAKSVLVWEADLNGASIKDPGESNRNYVLNKDGLGLGLICSSSGSNQFSIVGNALRFRNGGSERRLHITVAGTGTGGSSAEGAGFAPIAGRSYRLVFDAENSGRTGAASVRAYKNGNSSSANSMGGTTFGIDFNYPSDVSHNDAQHGEAAVGVVNNGGTDTVIYISNIKIYEILIVCGDCGLNPCMCPCKGCKREIADCICCPECKYLICACDNILAKWDFTADNYPSPPHYSASSFPSSSKASDVKPSNLEFKASFGANKGKDALKRNFASGYPSGKQESTDLDNVNIYKHMMLAEGSDWLKTFGWSTAQNYVYLELDTTGFSNLILRYDIRATTVSTPSTLNLQYSLDGSNWANVFGGEVSTRGPNNSVGITNSRIEHLPRSTYNKSKVYIRWTGTASSTSGHIEFRNIIVEQNAIADPGPEEEMIFTHINLAPGATPSSMGFAWFTKKGFTDTAIIQYAKTSQLVNGEMPETAFTVNGINATGSSEYDTNKVTITGLEPNTGYAYRVGNGEDWSNVYKINTGNPDSYEVIVVADPQIGSSASGWRTTVNRAVTRAPNASFFLSAGDQTAYGNDLSQVDGFVSPHELRKYPLAAIYGNHDHTLRSSNENIEYLPLLYQWPNVTPVEGVSDNYGYKSGNNYYFSYGDVLYIQLDSIINNVNEIPKHDEFIQKAIDSHPTAVWRILTMHQDMYGGGEHAGSRYKDAANMQKNWTPLISKYDIDIVYSGHDHIYSRSKFIKGDQTNYRQYMDNQMTVILGEDIYKRSPGTIVRPNGTLFMTLATAGAGFYDLEMQPWIAFADQRTSQYEYSVMKIEGSSLSLETYRITGDTEILTDKITLHKDATREDLQILLQGAKMINPSRIVSGKEAFLTAISAAEKVISDYDATTVQIHNAYTAIYTAYYAVTLSAESHEDCTICVHFVDVEQDGNYVLEVRNLTEQGISTKGKRYYMEQEWWEMPAFIVYPGDVVTVRGKNDPNPVVLKRTRTYVDINTLIPYLQE